jgi:uncharacterized protein (DUF2236 family)
MTQECMFGPETVTWKVNREGALFAGGPAALILQVSHPLVAAAVVRHSDYDVDPWGRLYRTLDTALKIGFGDPATSSAAAERLYRVHDRVRGSTPDGARYDALQADLLMWVWTTLLQTALDVYQRYVGQLTPEEMERYYQEQPRFLLACGGEEGSWPEDYAAFRDYYQGMIEDVLHPTEDTRRIVDSVLRPDLPLPLRPLGSPLRLLAVGLLPPLLRERLGLAWSPGRERLLRASAATSRGLMRVLPGAVRHFPADYAARSDSRMPRLLRRQVAARA